jgi:hypothetical protein
VEIPVYNLTRDVVKHIEISDHVFGVPFNQAVVHQAMVRQRQMLAREQLALKLAVRFPALPGSCFAKKALVPLGVAAEGRRCVGGVVSPLVLSPGAIGKQCLKKCVGWP